MRKKRNYIERWTNLAIKWKILAGIGIAICGLLFVCGLALLFGHLIMFLWNNTISSLFNTPDLTFWQAIMLFVLCRILFSNESLISHTSNKSKEDYSKCSKDSNDCLPPTEENPFIEAEVEPET